MENLAGIARAVASTQPDEAHEFTNSYFDSIYDYIRMVILHCAIRKRTSVWIYLSRDKQQQGRILYRPADFTIWNCGDYNEEDLRELGSALSYDGFTYSYSPENEMINGVRSSDVIGYSILITWGSA